jgi:hypothetical protein
MQKLSLVLAAASLLLATNAFAKENPCDVHATQADCAADHACEWSTTKDHCKPASGKTKSQ